MAQSSFQLGAIDSPHRENFSPLRTIFFVLIHLGALAVFWQTTWGAILVCIGLHILCGGFGICVGYHRLLTHRSFKTAKIVEYFMAVWAHFPCREVRWNGSHCIANIISIAIPPVIRIPRLRDSGGATCF